ncbi:MAG: acyltransferase [Oscillospiraceae bacterium]|nr:acyltransferase [Oscillospiraceae bacterium]
MKKRFHYLDILKFIAIFCVCFYHFAQVPVDLSSGFSISVLANRGLFTLCSVCVPLFMMVNGALLLNRPLNIKRHYCNLAFFFAVYWVWRIITFALLGAQAGYDFSGLGVEGLINHLVLMLDFGKPLLVDHFWFIIVYIRIQLILPLFKFLFDADKKDFSVCTLVIMAAIWISCFAVRDYRIIAAALPQSLSALNTDSLSAYSPFNDIYGIMVFYFILGGVLIRCSERLKRLSAAVYAAIFAAAATVQTLLYVLEHMTYGSGTDLVFGRYNTTTTIVMCISLFMLAGACENLFEKHHRFFAVFEAAGQHTISIFYMHWLAGKLVLPALNLPSGYPVSVAAISAMVFICTAISLVGRKIPVIKYLFGAVPHTKDVKSA